MTKTGIVLKSEAARAPETPAKPRLGRPPRIENTRGHILGVAAEIFAAKGFEAASMDEISTAVGSSKAAIYHYFDSKSSLFDALIVETVTEMLQTVQTAVDAQTSPPSKMRAYLSAHLAYTHANFAAVSTIVHSASLQNRPFTDEEVRLRAAFENLIGEIIAQGVKSGDFRAVDMAVTQKAILGMLAWTPKWLSSRPDLKAKRIADAYLDLILAGLTAKA